MPRALGIGLSPSFGGAVALYGASTAGGTLLGAEANGLAVDFTSSTENLLIRDSTAALNYSGLPFNANGGKLTFTRASSATRINSSGLIETVSSDVGRIDHTLAGVKRGLLMEEARTNLCLQSSDFTNASWTKSNMSTAKTATGPDGAANSATTLTATAGNATALQAITSASSARITSVYIKRRTGTGNIDITQDNGATWTTVSVTSSWARYSISSVTSTNPTVGIRIVTNADAVDVYGFQHELGSFITSLIPTTTVSVTRAEDVCSIATSLFPYLQGSGALIAQATLPTVNQGVVLAILNTSGFNNAIGIWKSAGYYSTPGGDFLGQQYDGSTDTVITIGTGANDGANHKTGLTWNATNIAGSLDGAAVVTGTYSNALPTTLHLGNRSGSFQPSGHIRQLTYIARRLTNAELQTRTT